MKDKPSQSQIASYLKWLDDPEGDARLQMALPLSADIWVEAMSGTPDYVKSGIRPGGTRVRENTAQNEPDAVSRIRALGTSGMSIRDISIRTGCDERFIKTVFFEPGRINRRYE